MVSHYGVGIIQSKSAVFHFRLCQDEMSLASLRLAVEHHV